MMIGREYSHVFPPQARARCRAAPTPVLECRNLVLDRPAARHLASTSAAARSSASAASTARASASCCSRSSACCAASRGEIADRRQAGRASPARTPAQAPGIGMALIPEDRKTEGLMLPMTVRENLSFAALDRCRTARHHRPRRRAAADRRDDQAPRHQDRRPRHPGRRALRRQPAEGRHRQVADEPPAHHPPQRPDPRHRRRHQAGDVPAPARPRRRRRRDPLLLHRL